MSVDGLPILSNNPRIYEWKLLFSVSFRVLDILKACFTRILYSRESKWILYLIKYFCNNIYSNWKTTHLRTTADVHWRLICLLQERFYRNANAFSLYYVFPAHDQIILWCPQTSDIQTMTPKLQIYKRCPPSFRRTNCQAKERKESIFDKVEAFPSMILSLRQPVHFRP